MLFYFTGTGNSLYAAKKIEENPVSIPQVIHNENLHFSADTIGIVTPVYGHEVPPMVKEFLHKATFHTDYFYMILTYGNRHGGAAELAKLLCEECGVDVKYINILWMVDNWLPAFDMNEQTAINKKVDAQIAAICADLSVRKAMIAPVTDADRAAHQEYLSRIEKVLICGGGTVNWSFLSSGVVDELSLLLSPVADGDPDTPTVFERMEQLGASNPALFHLKNVSQLKNDVVHLTYTTESQED